ncbi:MAG: guanine deaminase [Cyanobacteria bacterium J06597_16]
MSHDYLTAVRGSLLQLTQDPFHYPVETCLSYIADGLLVVADGRILAVGPYRELIEQYSNLPVTHYPDKLIVPGFIDTHLHFPQTEMIAAYGEQLLTWLERYTFPTEQQFSQYDYARTVADHFLLELLRHGTTTALVFTTVYAQSTEAFFEAAQAKNLRMIAGKVLMDRHAPSALLDTPETAYTQSKQLIEKWHRRDRLLYAVTPRFAITSTPAQLAVAGQLLNEFPDVYLHTHLAENADEIRWTAELFPEARSYLEVYKQAGLVGDRSVFAHGIHLNSSDYQTLHEGGCAIAHCPTSNLFLGSGLFPLHLAKQARVKVGLGTDIGAGTSFSMLTTGGEAYKVAQLQQQTLTPFQALYLATLGGAQALSLDDKLGNFRPGKEADFIVLDPLATTTLTFRNQGKLEILGNITSDKAANEDQPLTPSHIDQLQSLLFSLLILGDDRTVLATYIAGSLAHHREAKC